MIDILAQAFMPQKKRHIFVVYRGKIYGTECQCVELFWLHFPSEIVAVADVGKCCMDD